MYTWSDVRSYASLLDRYEARRETIQILVVAIDLTDHLRSPRRRHLLQTILKQALILPRRLEILTIHVPHQFSTIDLTDMPSLPFLTTLSANIDHSRLLAVLHHPSNHVEDLTIGPCERIPPFCALGAIQQTSGRTRIVEGPATCVAPIIATDPVWRASLGWTGYQDLTYAGQVLAGKPNAVTRLQLEYSLSYPRLLQHYAPLFGAVQELTLTEKREVCAYYAGRRIRTYCFSGGSDFGQYGAAMALAQFVGLGVRYLSCFEDPQYPFGNECLHRG